MAGEMICGNCLTVAPPNQRKAKVSDGGCGVLAVACLLLGILFPPLWFAVPVLIGLSLIMSMTSRATRKTLGFGCPTCKAEAMVPLDTPGGQMLLARLPPPPSPAPGPWQPPGHG